MKKLGMSMVTILLAVVMLFTGMMPMESAKAAEVVWSKEQMTYDNLMAGLGIAANTGVVTEKFTQVDHSESNIFADELYRTSENPVLISGRGNAAMGYNLTATIELPDFHLGETMDFRVYYLENGQYYPTELVKTNVATKGKTEVELDFGKVTDVNLFNKELYIFQEENGNRVPESGKNTAGMKPTHEITGIGASGGYVYIGSLQYKNTPSMECKIFQNPNEWNGPNGEKGYITDLHLGPNIRLYKKTNNGFDPIDDSTGDIEVLNEVYICDSTWDKNWGYLKLMNVSSDGSSFVLYGDYKFNVVYDTTSDQAQKLLDNELNDLSWSLANSALGNDGKLAPGVHFGDAPSTEGNSTDVGAMTKGKVVSLYRVDATGGTLDQADLKALDADEDQDSAITEKGLPIADNEYVVFNVVVPAGQDTVTMKDAFVGYRTSSGEVQHADGWEKGQNVDAMSRVIWNIVKEENGKYVPFTGTVINGQKHGGLVLAPQATIEVRNTANAVILVAEEVIQFPGMEIHQLSFNSATLRLSMKNSPAKNVTGSKTWADEGHEDKRPESIEVTLYASFWSDSSFSYGEPQPIKTITVTANDDWSWEFKGLPQYDKTGYIRILYTVKETPIPSYSPTFTENNNFMNPKYEGLDITNTYDETVVVVSGEKIWNDANNQDGKRPTSITVELQARYKKTSESNWSNWEKLSAPKYKNFYENFGYGAQSIFDGINDTLTITADDDWSWNFGGLRTKYSVWETRGHQAPNNIGETDWQYRVIETKFSDAVIDKANELVSGGDIMTGAGANKADTGYDVSYSSDSYNITNTHVPEKISLSGRKVWVETPAKNQQPVQVNLYIVNADGTETNTNKSVMTQGNATDGWTWTFTDLDKYKDGVEIQYTVKENNPPNGFWSEVETNENSGEITIYNIAKSIKLEGKKEWLDQNNNPTNAPDSAGSGVKIEIRRVADNKLMYTATAGSWTNWQWTSIELPGWMADGQPAEYEVKEIPIANYESNSYEETEKQRDDGTYTIHSWVTTNKLKTIELKVTKTWLDDDNAGNTRPNKLNLKLMRKTENSSNWEEAKDIKNQGFSAILDVANGQTEYTFTNLPEYNNNGERYEYKIEEYNENWGTLQGYKASYTTQTDADGNISYALKNALAKMTLAGTKVWVDASNANQNRPTDITLVVYQNGTRMNPQPDIAWSDKDKDTWTWTVANLDRYDDQDNAYTYTVEEVNLNPSLGYTVSYSEDGLTVYNTKYGRIRLYKESDSETDPDGTRMRLGGVKFRLYKDEACEQEVLADRAPFITYEKKGPFDRGEEGKLTIENVPYGTYWLKEVDPPEGYTLYDTGVYKVVVNGDPSDVEGDAINQDYPNWETNPDAKDNVVLNRKITAGSGSIALKKIDEDTNAPISGVVFTVYSDAACTAESSKGTMTEKDPTAAPGVYTMEGLAEGTYYVKETVPEGYQEPATDTYTVTVQAGKVINAADGSEFNPANATPITNKAITSVYATKAWLNADDTTTAPTGASVVFTLYANGEETEYTVTLDGTTDTTVPTTTGGYESEAWKATFVNLPKYQAGTTTEIVYTIAETTGYLGYTAVSTAPVATDGTITNAEEKTAVTATKAWVNADGTTTAPNGATVVFTLYANGEETEYTVTLDGTAETTVPATTGGYESEAWKATFVNLPKYQAGTTTEIVYTIAETTEYPGYTASTTDPVAAGGEITNTQVEVKTTATIRAEKEVDKQDPAELDKYSFQLYKLVPDSNDPTKMVEVEVDDPVSNNGRSIIFPQQTYTEEGTYQYVIRELPGTEANMAYDTTAYEVTVTVAKDEAGQLHAEVEYKDVWNLPVFENWSTLKVEIPVTKIVAPEGAAKDETFTFRMEPYASSPPLAMPTDALKDEKTGKLYALASVKGAGETSFTKVVLKYNDIYQSYMPQEFAWEIKEIPGTNVAIDYDPTVYFYVIKVSINDQDQLEIVESSIRKGKYSVDEAEIVDKVSFTNSIKTTTVSITKVWPENDSGQNISDKLTLHKLVNGVPSQTPLEGYGPDKEGDVYTWTGMYAYEGTEEITYVVKESGVNGYVTVYENGKNYALNDEEIVNEKIQGTEASFKISKTVESIGDVAANNSDVFAFSVTQTGAPAGIDMATFNNVNLKNGDAPATVSLVFPVAGEYKYEVREVIPADDEKLPGYTYDDAVYTVTFNVTQDDATATLTAGEPVWKKNGADTNATTAAFVNKYDEVKVNLEASKKLEGADLAADQFEFQLSGKGIETQTKKNDATGKITFDAISYKTVGEYTYTIKEVVPANKVDGYSYDEVERTVTVNVTKDATTGKLSATVDYGTEDKVEFINRYSETEATLSVTKELVHSNDLPDGEERVFTFVLTDTTGNGSKEVERKTLSFNSESPSEQSVSFSAITYKTAGTYTYTVTEAEVTDADITGDSTVYMVTVDVQPDKNKELKPTVTITKGTETVDVVKFTNTYNATVDISVAKEWKDENSSDRPANIQVQLYKQAGTEKKKAEGNAVTLPNAKGEWKYTWEKLLKYDAEGNEITYSVDEVNVPDGYVANVVTDNTGYNTTITNTKITGTTGELTISKTVESIGDVAANNSDVFAFSVTQTGVPAGIDMATFNNVNLKNGDAPATVSLVFPAAGDYVYEVREVIPADDEKLPGYTYDNTLYTVTFNVTQDDATAKLTAGEPVWKKNGADTNATTAAFVNKYDEVKVELEASKTLDGATLADQQFSFQLSGEGIAPQTKKNDADGKIVFDAISYKTAGTYTYTMKEVVPTEREAGYTYDEVGRTVTVNVTKDATGELSAEVNYGTAGKVEFINRYSETAATLTVTKELVHVSDLPDGEEHTFTFVLKDTNSNESKEVERKTLTFSNKTAGEQSVCFSAITYKTAGTYTYTVTEAEVTEEDITGDSTVYTVTVDVQPDENKELKPTVTITKANETVDVVKFTNTYNAKVNISGTKKWVGDSAAVRPDSITLYLAANRIVQQDKVPVFTDKDTDTWKWSFNDLPKYDSNGQEIEYTVSEEKITGYVTTYDKYDITNTFNPGKTTVKVAKQWKGDENAVDARPDSIQVQLYANNVPSGDAVTLSADDGWDYVWNNLDEKTNDGKLIGYTVKEVGTVAGYITAVKPVDGQQNTFIITNTYNVTSISGTKVWDDANNRDGVRPDSITIKLLADGQATDKSVTLTATEVDNVKTWPTEWKFENLPKYDVDGEEIAYTVAEEGVTGYTTTIDQASYTITNTYTPGTVNITVTKAWEDNNATNRPAITLTLYKGNNEIVTDAQGEKLAPTVNDNKYTWSNLPEKENGKIIVYYVKEDATAQGYKEPVYTNTDTTVTDKALNGGTITNTLAEGEATFDITKTLVNGAYLAEGQTKSFTFKLYEYDNAVEGAEVATTTITLPAADDSTENVLGQIKFDLKFGTHTYLLKEVKGTDTDIDYDTTQYKLELTAGVNKVENPGTLGLNDFKFTTMEGEEVTSLAFSNTYKYEADGKLHLEATKAMSSESDVQTMKADQFTFGIFKGEVQVSTGTNDEDGAIVFDEISYDQSDIGATYLYTVKELPGIAEDETYNYFYDDTVYNLSVSVTDGGNGKLIVTKTITKGTEAVDAIEFTNTIKNKVGHIGVMKVDKADDKKGLADAVFGVYTQVDADGKIVKTSWVGDIRTGETGAGSLQNLPIGTYYVQESMAPKGYQLDETVYTVVVEEGKIAMVNGEKVFNAKLGRLMLRKADRLNPDKGLPGAVYTVYDNEACLPETKVADITTGDDGIGYLDDVAPGTYWVKETKAPVGYEVDPLPYKVVIEENPDPEKPAFVQVTDFPLRGALVISKTVVGVEETIETFLFDIELSIATADPIVGSYEATLNGVATEKVTFAASEKGAKATVSLKSGDTLAISGVREGVTYTVTEQPNSRYDVTVNNVKANVATGTIKEGAVTVAAFQNTLKQTGFTVEKVWQGAEGGEIELTLFANGAKVEPQPEYTKEGNKYSYADLTMVDEKGQEILYTVKETAMAGYATSYKNIAPYADKTDCAYNGGQIINQALTSFSVKKEWAGLAEGETAPAIQLTLYCNGTIVTKATPKPDAKGWYVYTDLPATVEGKAAVYTVKEEPLSGYTTTYINKGENAAVTDCAYNGSTIVNSKIPQTGDGTPLALWMTTMLLAALGLVGLKVNSRKREN